MARKSKKSVVDLAAKMAAQEAIDEMDQVSEAEFSSPEERDMNLVLEDDELTPDSQREQKDVFVDGKAGAKKRFKSVRYRIYRDEKWLGTKSGDYSWEQLQKDHGGGSIRIVAVDSDNKFITSQALEVEYPENWNEKPEVQVAHSQAPSSSASPLEMMEVMKENQREAENKALNQQTGFATILSTMMQANQQTQQQTTQLMMQMMQESNKQFQSLILAMNQPKGPDPIITLLTTMITSKPKDDNGFTTANVLKMIQDAETRAEARTNKMQDQIDKKANELADMKAEAMAGQGDENEETGFKGLIKGFIPVLTQMVANQQAGQPTPEQMASMQENRRLTGGNQGLDQGFIDDLANRPGIPADPRMIRPAQKRPAPAPVQAAPVNNVANPATKTQESESTARQKDAIFNFCAPDIGNAMIAGDPASKTALIVLEKLEKEGMSRQTVANTFRLEDFYGYADKYGLPEEAKPWLKDFHSAIQEPTSSKLVQPAGAEPLAAAPSRPAATVVDGPVGPAKVVNGTGNGAAKPMAAKRSADPRLGPRAQPRPPSKNI